MRTVRRVSIFLLVLLLAVIGTFVIYAPKLVLYPVRGGAPDVFAHAPTPGVSLSRMRIEPEKGVSIEGFRMEPEGAKASMPTLILLHGICNSKDAYEDYARHFCREGFRVVAFDSRAHGKSRGGCCTYGWHEKGDVSKIIDEVIKIDPGTRIGIFGNSMGGAIALQAMAADKRIECGVIESTFADFREAVYLHTEEWTGLKLSPYLDPMLWRAGVQGSWNPFEVRPEESAKSIDRPVFLAHGTRDELFPISQGERIFRNLASPDKEWIRVEGGHHGGLGQTYGPEYGKRVTGFFKKWLM